MGASGRLCCISRLLLIGQSTLHIDFSCRTPSHSSLHMHNTNQNVKSNIHVFIELYTTWVKIKPKREMIATGMISLRDVLTDLTLSGISCFVRVSFVCP